MALQTGKGFGSETVGRIVIARPRCQIIYRKISVDLFRMAVDFGAGFEDEPCEGEVVAVGDWG